MDKKKSTKNNRTLPNLKSQATNNGASQSEVEIIQDLKKLGFGDYEARAYVSLLQCAPATAYEIAKVTGLPRANSYAVVKTLTEKNAILPISDKPVRYTAVDPKELFKGISDNTATLCKSIVKKLSVRVDKGGKDFVWLSTGKVNVSRKITELIEGANQHIWLKGPEKVIQTLMPDLYKAVHNGISVVIVLFLETGSSAKAFDLGKNCRIYLHEANGIVIGRSNEFLTISSDNERAIIATLTGDTKAAYSENPSFIYMLDIMLKHEFYMAEIMEQFGDQIEKQFGPGLFKLREVYHVDDPMPKRVMFDEYVERRFKELNESQ